MRTCEKSRNDVAQYDGLLEHLEDDGGYGSEDKDKRQVAD